ncbi:methylmalonyl-CoA epimerase [Ruminiclostridium papyrosolvens DSM 2782]|uniref:Methylmalonyl-CoA epimerase n=1 Tax=Ruminiclostridium papyrosolvens DSM 2782 TaxID=588581 RepID=F1TBU9_9FIRM|nr:VOC family protein [Ruminiclostridium papyrosolvens]EGD48120.1 methylmalonyl-CoA epimerase [Ruminiclostridium papyrosolvens DSM 2782]WES34996.1 VOC family protein [Ruminiclostridium papyrosolvens DSM 2782]
MKPAFKQLLQIGIIVKDVDASVKLFEEEFGMGPWEVSVMSNQGHLADLKIDGQPFDGEVSKMAFLRRFGMEFELIQPIGDTPYKKWLEEHGPGIHHIAVVTEDAYDDVLAKYKEKTGKEPWIRGQAMNNLMDFSYLDLRDQLGLIVECYRNIAPGRPALDYDPQK